MTLDYFKNKKIFVTGHTGFKGSWLCKILDLLGSEVYGYSLKPPTNPSLYEIANIGDFVNSRIGDIRDIEKLMSFYKSVDPDAVIHLAAQPLVREGYNAPRETYETNVMGTVNILECIRTYSNDVSFLNVTTDKVYYNDESNKPFTESDKLCGYDPYSNSKSCSELVTSSYNNSFFQNSGNVISTARAGNVIGGGDFAKDRLVPDCVRAAITGKDIIIRNPNSIRPYQHVLEPLYSYLSIISNQAADRNYSGSYNIGPDKDDCVTSGTIADLFCKHWGSDLKWITADSSGPHEASFLRLDNTLLKNVFGISPIWDIKRAIKETVDWTVCWHNGSDIQECMNSQIKTYLNERS